MTDFFMINSLSGKLYQKFVQLFHLKLMAERLLERSFKIIKDMIGRKFNMMSEILRY